MKDGIKARRARHEAVTRSLDMANRLAVELELMKRDLTRKHWGHVGDALWIEFNLKEICDRVFQEGEYSDEQNYKQGETK